MSAGQVEKFFAKEVSCLQLFLAECDTGRGHWHINVNQVTNHFMAVLFSGFADLLFEELIPFFQFEPFHLGEFVHVCSGKRSCAEIAPSEEDSLD